MFVVTKIRLSSTNICQDGTCALERSNQYRLTSQVDESHSSLLKRQLLRVFWLWNLVPMLKIRVILECLGEKSVTHISAQFRLGSAGTQPISVWRLGEYGLLSEYRYDRWRFMIHARAGSDSDVFSLNTYQYLSVAYDFVKICLSIVPNRYLLQRTWYYKHGIWALFVFVLIVYSVQALFMSLV